MIERKLPHEALRYFEFENKSTVFEKLERFRDAGLELLYMLWDFDRTITTKRYESDDDATTWSVLKFHLPPEGLARYDELFQQYRPLEVSGLMTTDDAANWTSSVLQIFVDCQINLDSVKRNFLEKVITRSFVRDAFEHCRSRNIPTVILSAGIGNLIQLWIEQSGIRPTLVHANQLVIETDGMIVGWERDKLVHVHNKKIKLHEGMLNIAKQRPHCILIGDGIDDAHMVEKSDSVLKIRLIDMDVSPEVKRKSLDVFDLILNRGDVEPLLDILRFIDG